MKSEFNKKLAAAYTKMTALSEAHKAERAAMELDRKKTDLAVSGLQQRLAQKVSTWPTSAHGRDSIYRNGKYGGGFPQFSLWAPKVTLFFTQTA